MKSIFHKLIIALLTFVIGVSAYSVWNKYNRNGNSPTILAEASEYSVQHGKKINSLCDIEKNPQMYAGKEIRLRALFDKWEYGIYASSHCSEDVMGWAFIELVPNEVANFPLPENIYPEDEKPKRVYKMDAVIRGYMDESIGRGCWGPKYFIRDVRVEQVIEIREFENSNKAVEWSKFNSY